MNAEFFGSMGSLGTTGTVMELPDGSDFSARITTPPVMAPETRGEETIGKERLDLDEVARPDFSI